MKNETLFFVACFALMLLLLVLSLTSCSLRPTLRGDSSATALPDEATCADLNRDAVAFSATAAGLGVLAGGSGVSSVLTSSTPRYVVGGVGVGLATMSAVFTYLGSAYSAEYSHTCTTEAVAR